MKAPRIDSHQHFWKFDPVRDDWIDSTMKIIQRDFLPRDLSSILRKNNIDGCISIQADQSENETTFLLSLAEKNPFIRGVVGWVDLKAFDVDQKLEYLASNKLMKGVRHILQAEPSNFMLNKNFQHGISLLEKYSMTYDILIFPNQISEAIELVQKYPKQRFVVDHLAKPNIKEKRKGVWKTNLESLAKCSNVSCKISGMVTEADWHHWKPGNFSPYLDVVFEAFGVDRIMYGSDWPVCLLASKYEQQLNIVENYISKFTSSEVNKIMGLNAASFYNID